MTIYLDNASTTQVFDQVTTEVLDVMTKDYGNPSSKHNMGFDAEKLISKSKKIIAEVLKVDEDLVYFTSGGTEANNIAIQGIAKAYYRDGKHLITTPIEHSSVRETFEYLESEGYKLSILRVDNNGIVDIEHLKYLLENHPDTTLISIMHVNNEMGVIQDIELISKTIKGINKNTLLHVDGVQAFCKIPLKLKRWQVDAYSISGHKIHGPKGIGALYLNKGIKLTPLIYGGHQQKGIRSGTQNMLGIVGLGKATELMATSIESYQTQLEVIKSYMIDKLRDFDNIRINSPISKDFSNHILSVSFLGLRGEVLLHALEEKGVYVSTGSACSTNKSQSSGFLERIGRNKEEAESNIRFSFSKYTTKDEIDITIEALKTLVPMLRRFKRK